MSGQIFAFQIARPLDAAPGEQESLDAHYDPQTQSMLWQGQTRAQATIFHVCTAHHNGLWYCSSDGVYCSAWGPVRITGGYLCDNIT
jgi:hypothetical protein